MNDVLTTTPPVNSKPVVLYDGLCSLCTSQATTLEKLSRHRVATAPLQEQLANFPGISQKEALLEMKMVDSNGRVYGGAESFVRLINYGYPMLGKVLYLYYVPGLRWLADKAYAWVARNRYKLFGMTEVAEACDDEACAVHFNLPQRSTEN